MKDKYGDDRRTKITNDATDIDIEDLIADEQVVVTISHEGYIKRMPLDTYRKQGRGGRGVIGADSKEGDFIETLFIASTKDYLMFFTNLGRVYWQKVYDVPQLDRGRARGGRSPTCWRCSRMKSSPRCLRSATLRMKASTCSSPPPWAS